MTSYIVPTGMPTGATFGVVREDAWWDRLEALSHPIEPGHEWASCIPCQTAYRMRPTDEDLVFCAICRCCSLLAEEPADGEDFCSGGCEPPGTRHAPLKEAADVVAAPD